jgi:hypothetical protein
MINTTPKDNQEKSFHKPDLAELFSKSASDFFTKPIMLRLLATLIVSSILVYFLGFYLFDDLYTLTTEISEGTYSAETISNDFVSGMEGIPYIGIYLAFVVAKIVLILLTVIGIFVGSYVTIIVSLIIAGFLTPGIIKIIVRRRGGDIQDYKGFGNLLTGILKILMIIALHLLVFILILPFLLIPFINFWLFTALIFSFFRSVIVYDVGSNMLDMDYYRSNTGMFNMDLFIITGAGFLLSSLPIVGIFSSVFTVIVLINYFLLKPSD